MTPGNALTVGCADGPTCGHWSRDRTSCRWPTRPPDRGQEARDGRLDFVLPPDLEAGEPPEARGLARDQVRLMVSVRASGTLVVHTQFRHLPCFLDPGDLLVINTSGTLNAALDGAARGRATELELHLSTHLAGRPLEWWSCAGPAHAAAEPYYRRRRRASGSSCPRAASAPPARAVRRRGRRRGGAAPALGCGWRRCSCPCRSPTYLAATACPSATVT